MAAPSAAALRPQAAALLAHITAGPSAPAPAQPIAATPSATPAPPAAAPPVAPTLAAAGPNGVVAVAGASGQGAAIPAAASNGPGTPLPAVANTVDLTPKFAGAVIPPQAPHAGTGGSAPSAGKTGEAPAAGPPSGPLSEHLDPAPAPVATAPTAASGKAQPLMSAPPAASAPAADPGASGAGPAHDAAVALSAPAAPPVIANGSGPGNPPATAPAAPAVPLAPIAEQVAVNLKRAIKAGANQIQIELNPASLGKIEVRLDFTRDGHFSAAISADRPETLHLLHSESHALEQSLRDAGLSANSGSLSFNLRGGETGAGQQQFAQSGAGRTVLRTPANDARAPVTATAAPPRLARHHGDIDIHV
ncbi:MAG TPA: flagellar hook-length control protein FliK [Stellaceae bacterium]|nr:flagellar hook-length control protein FliK [Stellaceae bacterium]